MDRKEYRKLWMREWRKKYRAKNPDRRKKNGKTQVRIRGRWSVAFDDVRI